MNKRLVLFDGNALVHRAFHAMPPLTVSKTGETVGAVYGFALILLRAINDLQPTHYAIAFDRKAPTFRHKLFDQYKAQRPATPSELVNQLGRVRQIVEAFHIPIFELDGYEADDILGTLSLQASKQDVESVIVTGDADVMQLVSPQVQIFYPKPRGTFSDAMLYDENAVIEKYGVKASQIADLKALKGDPSDNIPNIPGIGDKTAAKLIQQFGSIDQVFARIEEVEPEKLREMLRPNEALVRRSLELTTIVRDMPVTLDLDACCQLRQYDRNQAVDLFRELEFNSLITRLPETTSAETVKPAIKLEETESYHVINTDASLETLLTRLSSAGSFALIVPATDGNAMLAQPVGISISPAPAEAYYIPFGHTGMLETVQLPGEVTLGKLKPFLESQHYAKQTHDGKYCLTVMANNGIALNNISFDTMLAAHLLGEKTLTLKSIAFSRLSAEIKTLADLTGSGAKQIPFSQIQIEQAAAFACAEADTIGKLTDTLKKELETKGLWQLFADVEMPLVPVLAQMERNGIALDTDLLGKMSQRLGEQLAALEKEIYLDAGHEFNINSPSQLSVVLFEEQNLMPGRKTKGKYSTEASVLEELRGFPIVAHVLEYRQLIKLKSTYIDALPALLNAKTRRLHTSFNQAKTTTGRLSSSDPNLQNIPVRGDMGKEIRRAFIAPPGFQLLAGDYSQIDLRALAHLSQDVNLLSAFRNDEDIHSATAGQLFGVPLSEVKPEMRRLAKTVNFGVIYGMSGYGLEQATELSREDAAKFITAYFEKYPGVKQYLENTKAQARQKGYVETILHRRRYIPEINSPNRINREAAERMAINMPVQGTSADIIKVAMINLSRDMLRLRVNSRLLLQVHDELIFEVPENEVQTMSKLVRETMSSAMLLTVPLKVDIKTGHNWGEME